MNHGNHSGSDDGDATLRAVGRLPRDIEPSRDLWSGIEAAITAPAVTSAVGTQSITSAPIATGNVQTLKPKAAVRPRLISWPYALAAGVGCMALGGLLTLAVLRTQPGATTLQAPAAATLADVSFTDASFGGYQSLGPEYEQARAQLAIGLTERLDRLPPESRVKVERNLAEIRRSLREVNTALALDPDSTLLQQLLLSTYQSELTLLANVNQIAGSVPARSET